MTEVILAWKKKKTDTLGNLIFHFLVFNSRQEGFIIAIVWQKEDHMMGIRCVNDALSEYFCILELPQRMMGNVILLHQT